MQTLSIWSNSILSSSSRFAQHGELHTLKSILQICWMTTTYQPCLKWVPKTCCAFSWKCWLDVRDFLLVISALLKNGAKRRLCSCTLKFGSFLCCSLLMCNVKWPSLSTCWGCRADVVVRTLASPGSIFRFVVICGLSLLMLYFTPRGFSPGTPVFPSPQKPTFDLICVNLLIQFTVDIPN